MNIGFMCLFEFWISQGTHVVGFLGHQFSTVTQYCLTLYNPCQPSLSITNSRSLPKIMSIEWVMPSNPLILCCSLLLPPSIFPSIRVFSNESVLCIRWPKYWSFSFNISPSMITQEWSPLGWTVWISLQSETLKSLLQHHGSKASILQCSAFFIVQLSHSHMTTERTIALTRLTFVDKVMSLLFNMLSRLIIDFFLKMQASFNFLAAVTNLIEFGAQENKVWCHCFHCFPI